MGRLRVARLMRCMGIEGISRRGKRLRTTVPDPAAPPAPDLVKRRFQAVRPNRIWLADLTYIPTHEGWLFLAAVMDMFSRKVVGWSMRDDMKAELVHRRGPWRGCEDRELAALRVTCLRHRPSHGLPPQSGR